MQQMIKDHWDERVAFLTVDVVKKGACNDNASSAASRARCVSGVTNEHSAEPNDVEGCGDTCSTPPPRDEQPVAVVDWSILTIQENPKDDGTATQLVDEDQIYEAMGFKEAEAREEEHGTQEVPIPAMSAQMHEDMNAAAVDVDDIAHEEPLYEWDRDNPDMSVGTVYPSMEELRLAIKQYAIKREFELVTEHSDTERYRVCCGALGCPWKLRARTQHDGSVRVHFLIVYTCFL